MYSLVILFSNDRIEQLNIMHDCWGFLAEDFDQCEKILVVDGPLTTKPKGDWIVLEIERRSRFYCWADTLNAGVQRATRPYVFYYDSDRIVPHGHVQYCLQVLHNRPAYVYAEKLYGLCKHMTCPELCALIQDPMVGLHREVYPDFRVSNPEHYEHKNPFAGGVAFRRETFLEHGGFDTRFVGWGYPDFDFFMNTTRRGAEFVKAPYVELHQKHDYQAPDATVWLHNAWNCWQYVRKWDLDPTYVDQFWRRLNIPTAARGCRDLNEFLSCV